MKNIIKFYFGNRNDNDVRFIKSKYSVINIRVDNEEILFKISMLESIFDDVKLREEFNDLPENINCLFIINDKLIYKYIFR